MNLKIHSLSIRYLLSFFLLVILPVFIFTFFSSLRYSRSQRELSKIQMQETVNQMADNLNDEIASLSILSSALIHNESFREVCDLYDWSLTPRDIYLKSEAMDLELSKLFLYTNKQGIIYVHTQNKPVFLFRNYPMASSLPTVSLPQNLLVEALQENPGSVRISKNFFALYEEMEVRLEDREPLLILGIRPHEEGSGASIDKIIFAYKIQVFDRIYNNSSLQQYSYISDSEGNILLSAREGNLPPGLKDGRGWLELTSPIQNTGWILHHAIDLQAFMAPVYRTQRVSYMIFVLLFVFFILYTVYFFHSMISPLNILIEKMTLVEEGDYSVRVPEPSEKELNNLFHSFNRMIRKVRDLTDRQSRIDREKGLLELQALQYQINPHFIANTLNSIRLMAVVKKNENIKNMTASLMKIVNDSFRGEGNKTRLGDENSALISYVHIMKVRFSIPIELRFSIPEELEDVLIQKMILQPIVENSIIHGFAQKEGKGIILIKGIVDEKGLKLQICDNGSGFSLEGSELPDKPGKKMEGTLTRVGIRNVDRRIKLNFGDDYGLKMASRPGFYTSTHILLPFIKDESND